MTRMKGPNDYWVTNIAILCNFTQMYFAIAGITPW